jgi:hypothetical protein
MAAIVRRPIHIFAVRLRAAGRTWALRRQCRQRTIARMVNPASAREAGLAHALATSVLGVDTLWGGDVLSASGTGRFIADSWFADQPLPPAYRCPEAAPLRKSGGVSAPALSAEGRAEVDRYLAVVDLPGALGDVARGAREAGGLRGAYLAGLSEAVQVMWELAEERLGRGPAVPYERCVLASTGRAPTPADPTGKREEVRALLAREGRAVGTPEALLAAVDAWRAERRVPEKAVPMLADAFIARLDAGAARHLVPHLPQSLREIPRANVAFLPVTDAWFSGSMNYLGRARTAAGLPEFEATYELNAQLEISVPEFAQLVAHEVVPGHVTTFALLQALHVAGALGFEATVLTMNTRYATLSEGIANNALLLALGVRRVEDLPDPDLQMALYLTLLQDDAKSQSSWLTWREGAAQADVAATLRREYLCSAERADKLSGAWGRHPLLGRMYLPAYRAGTEKVAELLARHPLEKLVPALYGARGMVDVVTIDQALAT